MNPLFFNKPRLSSIIRQLILISIVAVLSSSVATHAETINGPANVRLSPKGNVIFSLNNGVQVIIADTVGDWYQIRFNAVFDNAAVSAENKIRNGAVFSDEAGSELGKTLGELAFTEKTELNGRKLIMLEGFTHKQNIARQPARNKSTADDIAKHIEQKFSSQSDSATKGPNYEIDLCYGIAELIELDPALLHYQLMLRIAKEDKHVAVRSCAIAYFERAKSETTEKAFAAHRAEIIAALIPYLRDNNRDIRYKTARVLLAAGEEAALTEFENHVKEEQIDIYFIFNAMTGKPWEPRGINIIRTASKSSNVELRAKALLYLIILQKENRIPDQIALLKKQVVDTTEGILKKTKWDTNREYSDGRAMGAIISAISALGDLKLIPLLQRIAKHPESSYLQRDAEEAIVAMQLKHCVEPDLKKPIRTSGRAYIDNNASPIGYLRFGLVSGFESIMEALNLTAQDIKLSQITGALAKEIPYLIIPEGALGTSGFAEANYAKLQDYARNGGTLVVLSQQRGSMYSKLMDGIEAVGYDEGNPFKNMQINITEAHRMFEGFSKKSLLIATDGYFKKLSSNTKTILYVDKLNLPVFIEYPLGKGTILASTTFSPLAFINSWASEDEVVLFREMITYFEYPRKLAKVRPGENAIIKLKVTNENKKSKATKAVAMVYGPERKIMRFRKEFPISLKPGDSMDIEFDYATCASAPLGTWHIKYELNSEGYQLMTSELDPEGTNVWLEYALQSPQYAPDSRFIIAK